MVCIFCDNETDWTVMEKPILQVYRGKDITVATPVCVCVCGGKMMTLEQADELVKRTKAAYAKLTAT